MCVCTYIHIYAYIYIYTYICARCVNSDITESVLGSLEEIRMLQAHSVILSNCAFLGQGIKKK